METRFKILSVASSKDSLTWCYLGVECTGGRRSGRLIRSFNINGTKIISLPSVRLKAIDVRNKKVKIVIESKMFAIRLGSIVLQNLQKNRERK